MNKSTNLSLQFLGDDEVFRLDCKMFSATLIFFNFGVSLLDDDEAVLDFRSVFGPALDRFLAGLSCGTFRSKVLTCGKYLQFFLT